MIISGLVPPPETLAGYEAILPGAADRMIGMAEKQLVHRHEMESAEFSAEFELASRGQWTGFAVAITILMVVAGLIAAGKTAEGLATVVAAVAALAAAFYWSQGKARASAQGPVRATSHVDLPPVPE